MIKINLLPRTVNEKAIVRNIAIAFAVALIAIVVGGATYSAGIKKAVAAKEQEAASVEQLQTEVQGYQKQAQDQLASIKPIQDKLTFIKAVLDFNKQYPKLYGEVATWTYKNVMYTSMICDGTQVTMTARAKTLDDVGRFLLNMYRATSLFTEVTISGVPGYGQSQQNGSGGLPGMPSMAGAPGMPGMPSMPAPPMMSGGSMASLAGMSAITSGVMDKLSNGQKWIDFSVVCKLKTPITAPSFGAGAAAGAAGGAPGGAAPAPGAMPGMPMPSAPGAPGAPAGA